MTLTDWAYELLAHDRAQLSDAESYEADMYLRDGDAWLVAFDRLRARIAADTLSAADAHNALSYAEQGAFRRLSSEFATELRSYLKPTAISA